jgi:hypothetical protein
MKSAGQGKFSSWLLISEFQVLIPLITIDQLPLSIVRTVFREKKARRQKATSL